MADFRTTLRRVRTLLWTALTLVILLAAVLVGVGKLLMPYSAQYQPQLEDWLSREFGQRVVVDSFTGEWEAFGPRISFEGVTLMGDGGGEGEIAIRQAALDVKPLNLLIPGRPLYSFRIIGADLALVRMPDGHYELSGLGVSGRDGGDGGFGNLARVGEVRLEGSSLSFDDAERGIHVQLTGMVGRLQMNGRQVSTELQADISDRFKARVLGDLKATLLIELDEEQRLANARWHIKTGELMVSELVQQLPRHALVPKSGWLNAEVWGSWSPQTAQLMEGVIDLRDSVLADRPDSLQLDHLNSRFRWRFEHRKAWRIDLSDLLIEQAGESWRTERMSLERNLDDNLGLWVSSDFVDIAFPLQLTQRIMSHYETPWPKSMPRQATGRIHAFDLVLDGRWKLYLANGEIETLDAWDWGRYPDVAGIRGSLALENGEGEARFSGQGVRLDWPRNFRRHAVVDLPQCLMEIRWAAQDWAIDARDCELRHEHITVSGRSRFKKSEGKPELDINLAFSGARLAELDDYWPASVMPDTVVSWLSTGIIRGTAQQGRFSMRGDLDDWPFRQGEGLLHAEANIADAALEYQPDWPRAERMDLQAEFHNTSLSAHGVIGDLGGAAVHDVTAHIEDFKQPRLVLDYQSDAGLSDVLGFIRRTPLVAELDLDFDRFTFAGPARTHGRFAIPLGAAPGEQELMGQVDLLGNRFSETTAGVSLESIEGALAYDLEGFDGRQLSARFADHPATLDIRSDWDDEEVFAAVLSGTFPVEALIPRTLLDSEPLLGELQGSSHWSLDLSVAGTPEAGPRETWLTMQSDLQGVAIGLPVPFNKAASPAWPLRIRYPLRADVPVFSIEVADRAHLAIELGEGLNDPQRANVALGGGPGELPSDGAFTITGAAEAFDMDGWMDAIITRFQDGRGAGTLTFDEARLSVGRLQLLNREFEDVDMSLVLREGILEGTFDSTALAGDIRYSQSEGGSHSLSAQLERLFLPEPLTEGMTMDTDPSRLPEMHLFAREFSYMGLELGETRIEAFPVRDGLRVDSVEAASEELNFQARGDWTKVDGDSRSDFDIMLTSESLGSLMHMLDISSVLEGGQTVLRYDAWWPGPPAAFAMAILNGHIEFSVVDGRILNADPGAGRVVGLLSLSALPRRLALDFRDVFGSGFNFDQAHGTITLQDGTAYTDDLVLESTAATMAITGSSDLVEKQYDYLMAVRPGVSQTLPALGAVIGGPGGAAAGLALQGLLRKSLGDATEALYTIRGPWSSPEVEPVSAPSQDNTGSKP
ncbi:MAG: TIGR02099 family protein [Xanthomonadales bacterium]|nr:TIGR02099 family protein [Xanthomonadales bacterium]